MPYTNEFFATKKVIYTNFIGDVSLEDVAGATSQAMEHLNRSETLLSVLTEVTDVLTYPERFIDVWQISKPIFKHKRLSAWAIVGVKSQFLRVVLKMVAKFGSIPYREFETLEEGFAFLEARMI
jgi:hypothetical protein